MLNATGDHVKSEMPADNVGLLTDLPYADRQLIVVTEDALAAATRKEERKELIEQRVRGVNWMRIAEAAALDIVPLVAEVAEITREALRAWARARESGVKVLPIGRTAAKALSFPPGHPRDGILYIGHPALPNVYYTMAEFHRVTFQHKFCEAVELLMNLGATHIRVEHVEGWSKDFSAHLSVPLGTAGENVKGEASTTGKGRAQLLYEANLTGKPQPSVPNKLAWYPHEPTWQLIAKGRLEFGLADFSLSVSYEDDFGVNAGLKAAVVKAGLDLGGKFEDHQSTVWRMEGKFREASGESG